MNLLRISVITCFIISGCSAKVETQVASAPNVPPLVPPGYQSPAKSELDKIQEEGRGDSIPPPAEEVPSTAKPDQGATNDGYCPSIGPHDKGQYDSKGNGNDEGCNTKTFKAQEIFDIDNCRVYRFEDGSGYQYFQDCAHR